MSRSSRAVSSRRRARRPSCVKQTVLGVDVIVRLPTATAGELAEGADRVRRVDDELSLTLPASADVDAWLDRAHAQGAKVIQISPRHETLEDLFVRQVAEQATP